MVLNLPMSDIGFRTPQQRDMSFFTFGIKRAYFSSLHS